MDYISKIKKLLALSESKNENEAKAALLKARKLMAEHKVSEDALRKELMEIRREQTKWTYTSRRNSWMVDLATLISEKYCCKMYVVKQPRKKTKTIGFFGYVEDLQTCIIAFDYAVETVLSGYVDIKKRRPSATAKELTALCNGYGLGFCRGLQDAFREQDYQGGYDLILSVSDEVINYGNESFDRSEPVKINNVSMDLWDLGVADGMIFGKVRKLQNALPAV